MALAAIPPERARMHLRWAIYEGPYHCDVLAEIPAASGKPMRDVILAAGASFFTLSKGKGLPPIFHTAAILMWFATMVSKSKCNLSRK
jgi:hypothetical protein